MCASAAKCIWSHYDIDILPLTLKTFPATPTHIVNMCAKFHWNPSTKYRYIDIDKTLRYIYVSGTDRSISRHVKYVLLTDNRPAAYPKTYISLFRQWGSTIKRKTTSNTDNSTHIGPAILKKRERKEIKKIKTNTQKHQHKINLSNVNVQNNASRSLVNWHESTIFTTSGKLFTRLCLTSLNSTRAYYIYKMCVTLI